MTGVAATCVHVLIAWLLIAGGYSQPALANALASISATFFSYVTHTVWSFSASFEIKGLVRFLAVSSGSCLLSTAIAAYAENVGLPYLLGIVLVVCIVPIVSFTAHHLWTYRPR